MRRLFLLGCVLATLAHTRAGAADTNALPAPKAGGTNAPVTGEAAKDDVVAKGKGLEIRRSQLDREVLRAVAQQEANGRPVTIDQKASIERQILEQLINVELLEMKATPADKAAGKEAAEKRLETVKAKVSSPEAFKRQMKFMGVTPELLVKKWTEVFTGESVAKRDLEIKIPDADIKKFYDENPRQFTVPERVRASQILVAIRDPATGNALTDEQKAVKWKEAESLLKRARAGEDFGKLAAEYSNDAGSRAKGGEYVFSRGQMTPEVENVVFEMKPGQISEIITSPSGYHIIKLSEKLPPHKITLAEATPDIRDGLLRQALEQKFPDYIAQLRKQDNVEILDEKLKPKDPMQPGVSVPAGQ